MLIIHGTYHWRPRRTAFRNDYCRSCDAERLSVLIRTFDALHIYWIPVLPLGFWSRWFCTSCGSRPHAAVRTRQGFKIAGLATVALMSLILWMAPVREFGDDAWIVWLLRVGLFPVAAALVFWIVRQPREPSFNRRLAAVKPIEGWTCPLCGGQLLNLPTWHCPSCQVEHRPLAVRV